MLYQALRWFKLDDHEDNLTTKIDDHSFITICEGSMVGYKTVPVGVGKCTPIEVVRRKNLIVSLILV